MIYLGLYLLGVFVLGTWLIWYETTAKEEWEPLLSATLWFWVVGWPVTIPLAIIASPMIAWFSLVARIARKFKED